jgi:hypothetical protein
MHKLQLDILEHIQLGALPIRECNMLDGMELAVG